MKNIRQQRIWHMRISDGYYDATTWFPNAPEDIEDVKTLSSGKETWTVTVRLDFNGEKDTIPIQEHHSDTGQDVVRNYISWHFDLACHARQGGTEMFNVRLSRKDLALMIDHQKDFVYDLLLGNGYAVDVEGVLSNILFLLTLEVASGDACGGTEFLLAIDKQGHLSWIRSSNYFPYPGYFISDKFSPDGKQYFSGTTFFTTSGPDTSWDEPEGYVLDALRLDADLFLIAWSDSNGEALPATLTCLDWNKKILASVHLNLMTEGLGYQIGYHDESRQRVIIRDEQDQKYTYSPMLKSRSLPQSHCLHLCTMMRFRRDPGKRSFFQKWAKPTLP